MNWENGHQSHACVFRICCSVYKLSVLYYRRLACTVIFDVEAFVTDVKRNVLEMERLVDQAEADLGSVSTVKKVMNSVTLPSLFTPVALHDLHDSYQHFYTINNSVNNYVLNFSHIQN